MSTLKLTKKFTGMTHTNWYPWLVLIMSCMFLFYKYIAQVSPSVMTMELMQQFHINATGLGGLAACYFYSYLVAQLFVGPLLDRYSTRYLSFVALLVMGLGLFGFAHSHTLLQAYASRMLVGFGAAFATVSYLKLAAVWFSEKHYNLVVGFCATAASVGAIVGETPLAYSVEHIGWQHTLVYCALLGGLIAVLYCIFIRDKSKANSCSSNNLGFNFSLMKMLFTSKKVWLITLYSGLAWAPLSVFGGLWGIPFLQAVYHVDKTHAASLVTMSFVGLAIGSPLCGYLASRLKNRLLVMFLGLFMSFVAVCFVLSGYSHSLSVLAFVLFLFGFATGPFTLGFSFGRVWFPVTLMATFIGIVNTGDGLFTLAAEPFVGKLLDIFWNGKVVNGIHVYDAHSYHLAMMALPVFILLAVMVLFFVRKNCVE